MRQKKDLSDRLNERYKLFTEYVENPARFGAVGILCKIRPSSKELVKSKLMDRWQEVDKHLYEAMKIMNRTLGWFKFD